MLNWDLTLLWETSLEVMSVSCSCQEGRGAQLLLPCAPCSVLGERCVLRAWLRATELDSIPSACLHHGPEISELLGHALTLHFCRHKMEMPYSFCSLCFMTQDLFWLINNYELSFVLWDLRVFYTFHACCNNTSIAENSGNFSVNIRGGLR